MCRLFIKIFQDFFLYKQSRFLLHVYVNTPSSPDALSEGSLQQNAHACAKWEEDTGISNLHKPSLLTPRMVKDVYFSRKEIFIKIFQDFFLYTR